MLQIASSGLRSLTSNGSTHQTEGVKHKDSGKPNSLRADDLSSLPSNKSTPASSPSLQPVEQVNEEEYLEDEDSIEMSAIQKLIDTLSEENEALFQTTVKDKESIDSLSKCSDELKRKLEVEADKVNELKNELETVNFTNEDLAQKLQDASLQISTLETQNKAQAKALAKALQGKLDTKRSIHDRLVEANQKAERRKAGTSNINPAQAEAVELQPDQNQDNERGADA